MKPHVRRALLGLLVLALALPGCASGAKGKAVKVTGNVTLEGAPVSRVTVSFIPTGSGLPATAVTDVNGRFELITVDSAAGQSVEGAIPGDYKVTVRYIGDAPAEDLEQLDPKTYHGRQAKDAQKRGVKSQTGGGKGTAPKEDKVHPNYGSADRTPLKQSISPQGGTLEIRLKKDGTA